jgi:hypothetical protein
VEQFRTLRGGREAIFWQSPRNTAKARPAVQVPTRRASRLDELRILADTRERYLYRFAKQQAAIERQTLPAGDYAVRAAGELVVVVERKSLQDLAANLVDGSLAYALAALSTVGRAALVVEDRYALAGMAALSPCRLGARSRLNLRSRPCCDPAMISSCVDMSPEHGPCTH